MPIGPLVPGTPTTVTPDASPPPYTSTQGPAPDGPVVADDVLAAHLIALNIQQNLTTRLITTENSIPGISTLSSARIYPSIASGYGGATVWANSVDSGGGLYWAQTNNDAAPVYCELSPYLPLSGRLLSIGMRIQPASGHTALPAVLPTATLYLVSRANFATSVDILTATHPATTVAQYENYVFFEASLGTSHLINHEYYMYYIRFTGESGTDYVGGLRVYGIELRVTP